MITNRYSCKIFNIMHFQKSKILDIGSLTNFDLGGIHSVCNTSSRGGL